MHSRSYAVEHVPASEKRLEPRSRAERPQRADQYVIVDQALHCSRLATPNVREIESGGVRRPAIVGVVVRDHGVARPKRFNQRGVRAADGVAVYDRRGPCSRMDRIASVRRSRSRREIQPPELSQVASRV